MKKVFMGSMLVVSVSFMSCGSTDSAEVDKTIMPAESAIPQVNNGAADSSNSVQVINTVGGVGGTQPVIGAAPTKAASAINTKGSSAPNPAHGQPGHRCDIAVGAPLNSPVTTPAQPQAQTVSSAPSPSVITPAATPVSSDPNVKLNPAHGQPGHDCAIAVGAPLKKN